MKVSSDRHIEVQGLAGGCANKVYKHLPVALDSGLVSFAPPSIISDTSSSSDENIKKIC